MNLSDWYHTLDLEEGATLQDIRTAYRQLAKVWHPDRFVQDPQLAQIATEKLKNINHAYEKLCEYFQNRADYPSPSEHYSMPKNKSSVNSNVNQSQTSNNWTKAERSSLWLTFNELLRGNSEISSWNAGKLGLIIGVILCVIINIAPTDSMGWASLLIIPSRYIVGLLGRLSILRIIVAIFSVVFIFVSIFGLIMTFIGRFTLLNTLRGAFTGGSIISSFFLVLVGLFYVLHSVLNLIIRKR